MIAGQSIAGLSVAGIPIATANRADQEPPHVFAGTDVSYTFTPPKAGRWKFVGWGPGHSSGASGAYVEITRFLNTSQSATLHVGGQGVSDTTITLPGAVATAGRAAAGPVVGAATGGDVNLAGSLPGTGGSDGVAGLGTGGGAGGDGDGSTYDGGGGAPANLPFRGAAGGDENANEGPGVGAGAGGRGAGLYPGGPGLILAVYVGP